MEEECHLVCVSVCAIPKGAYTHTVRSLCVVGALPGSMVVQRTEASVMQLIVILVAIKPPLLSLLI